MQQVQATAFSTETLVRDLTSRMQEDDARSSGRVGEYEFLYATLYSPTFLSHSPRGECERRVGEYRVARMMPERRMRKESRRVQSGVESEDALSLKVIFRKRAL